MTIDTQTIEKLQTLGDFKKIGKSNAYRIESMAKFLVKKGFTILDVEKSDTDYEEHVYLKFEWGTKLAELRVNNSAALSVFCTPVKFADDTCRSLAELKKAVLVLRDELNK